MHMELTSTQLRHLANVLLTLAGEPSEASELAAEDHSAVRGALKRVMNGHMPTVAQAPEPEPEPKPVASGKAPARVAHGLPPADRSLITRAQAVANEAGWTPYQAAHCAGAESATAWRKILKDGPKQYKTKLRASSRAAMLAVAESGGVLPPPTEISNRLERVRLYTGDTPGGLVNRVAVETGTSQETARLIMAGGSPGPGPAKKINRWIDAELAKHEQAA